MTSTQSVSIDKLFFRLGLIFVLLSFALVWYPQYMIFDEPFHVYDIHRYFAEKISISSIQRHKMPTGILSYILPAVFGKLFQSDHIFLIRLTIWICVLISYLNILWNKNSNVLFKVGFLMCICNPYSFLCSTSFMTEFVALVFVINGLLFIQSNSISFKYIGYFLLGLSIITRLYFLALLPAIFLPELLNVRSWKVLKKVIADFFLFGMLTIIPTIFLIVVWKGLTPPLPLELSGDISKVELNGPRFIVSTIYLGFYISPFIFFLNHKIDFKNWRIWVVSVVLSILILFMWPNIFNLVNRPISTGIIFSTYKVIGANLGTGFSLVFNFLIISGSLMSVYYFGELFFKNQKYKSPLSLIAGLFVLFFLIQQFFVGGNIAFYERYILSASFFIGILFVPKGEKMFSRNFSIVLLLLFVVSFVKALMVHNIL